MDLADNKIRILIAGDFAPTSKHNYPTKEIFKELEKLGSYDYKLVNLEGPLTSIYQPVRKTGPNLSIDPEWAKVISANGFKIVSLANNHILDMGANGLTETINHCEAAGILHVGAGANILQSRSPLRLRKGAHQIAIIARAEEEFSIATESTAGAAPIDPIEDYYEITKLRKDTDGIIVILHAGNEKHPLPRPGLKQLCRFYVDIGADLVVCHHAHYPSGCEVYKNKFISYGLGNLFFPVKKEKSVDWFNGYFVSLNIDREVLNYEIIPYSFDIQGIHIFQGNEKTLFMEKIEHRSEIISSDDLLHAHWQKFCAKNQKEYISHILAYNKFDRYLFKTNILKPRHFRKKMVRLLNYFRCDSHREAIIRIIEQELDKC